MQRTRSASAPASRSRLRRRFRGTNQAFVIIQAVAATDRFQLPLRWQFIPVEHPTDRSIRWKWTAYSQDGELALESEVEFETLTQCMNAAQAAGYGRN